MPNFNTHKIVNFIVFILITLFLFYYNFLNYLYPLFFLGYYIGTIYITPDLDINSKPSNSKIWWIYKKLSNHRGKTHSLIYGFLFPIIYLLFFIIGIVYIVGIAIKDSDLFINFIKNSLILININYIYIIVFLTGILTANGIHILLDKITGKL